MRRKSGILVIIGWWLLWGAACSIVQPGKTTATKEVYTEDLQAYRPGVPEPITVPADSAVVMAPIDSTVAEVGDKLNTVLDTAAAYARATLHYIDGFTIQVYGGDDRALAKEYRLKLLRFFPATEPRMVFEQPNYKVRVGEYYTRLEAQPLFVQIKEVFPKAILIPKRISIK